ncbi:hypothetical protein Scep_002941 [Stephania cephalantha]|uniref:N-acetyltransferase domain-containing protein n=1 Tax=Stephania cephalantha TaxID=152367 RepID=A0AAP0LBY5_9MAGN
MAQFKAIQNKPKLSASFFTGSTCIRSNKCTRTGLHYQTSIGGKNVTLFRRIAKKRKLVWETHRHTDVVPYCSTTSSEVDVRLVEEGGYDVNKGKFGYLVNEFGWRVRRLVEEEDEMRKVAQVQAESFHDPVVFFNDLFFQFFKAEVLSGLIYKLRNSPPNRYACLIAEPAETADSLPNLERRLVGVADVTALRDESVLCHLEGAEEYLYVSGIAVSKEYRRRKVATALLKACDLLALLWGFDYLVLRAYEDDLAARTVYQNAGYRVVSGDPPWMTTWIGRKRRVLMLKRSSIGM